MAVFLPLYFWFFHTSREANSTCAVFLFLFFILFLIPLFLWFFHVPLIQGAILVLSCGLNLGGKFFFLKKKSSSFCMCSSPLPIPLPIPFFLFQISCFAMESGISAVPSVGPSLQKPFREYLEAQRMKLHHKADGAPQVRDLCLLFSPPPSNPFSRMLIWIWIKEMDANRI